MLVGQIGIQQQFGHSNDAIHGGADLVRHVGQELALGPVGALRLDRHPVGLLDRLLEFRAQGKRFFLGPLEHLFSPLPFGDIPLGPEYPQRFAVVIPSGDPPG